MAVTEVDSNNWLEPFRLAAGFSSRPALAAAMHVGDKTIQRWETYQTHQNIPFPRLAERLNTDQDALRKAHQAGLRAHQITLIEVDPGRIAEALRQCAALPLTGAILQRLKVERVEQAAALLGDWIRHNRRRELFNGCNQPIQSAVAVAEHGADLDKIRGFVGSIALSAVIAGQDLDGPCQLRVQGTDRAWTLRLMVDAALDFPMTQLRVLRHADSGEPNPIKLDPASTKAVRVPATKAEPGDHWARVRELVATLAQEAFFHQPCPHLEPGPDSDQPALRAYCADLDLLIEQTNGQHHHCFAYTLMEEAQPVRNELLRLLPALRLFICVPGPLAIPVLRLDERRLEAWIANALGAIEARQEQLALHTPVNPATEQPTMPGNSVQLTVNHAENIAVAGEQASVHAHAPPAELTALLAQLQASHDLCDLGIPKQRQLRGELREIIDSGKKTGQPPANGRQWLEDTKTGLGLSGQLVGTLSKALALWQKTGWGA